MPPTTPPPQPEWPIPRLDLKIEDLAHPGALIFLRSVDPLGALKDAVVASFNWLYTSSEHPTSVQQITLVLKPMEGVAYTFGSDTHKEIHFSLNHIVNCADRAEQEILGVLVHEVVHCYQYNGKGTTNGGLIEGIADFVRLNCKLGPPHWKPPTGPNDKWDGGYQTTAYFLDWIEHRYGAGTIRELNGCMKDREYDELMFKKVTGRKVERLWLKYREHLANPEEEPNN